VQASSKAESADIFPDYRGIMRQRLNKKPMLLLKKHKKSFPKACKYGM